MVVFMCPGHGLPRIVSRRNRIGNFHPVFEITSCVRRENLNIIIDFKNTNERIIKPAPL
jgi:hypothetical protein